MRVRTRDALGLAPARHAPPPPLYSLYSLYSLAPFSPSESSPSDRIVHFSYTPGLAHLTSPHLTSSCHRAIIFLTSPSPPRCGVVLSAVCATCNVFISNIQLRERGGGLALDSDARILTSSESGRSGPIININFNFNFNTTL